MKTKKRLKFLEKITLLKKYNSAKLELDVMNEKYDRKLIELEVLRKTQKKKQEIWEQKLKEQEEEIIRLKKRGVKNVSNTKASSTRVSRKKQDNK